MTDEWKPRTGQKIETLYAWVATEEDGGEGLMAARIGDVWLPMIGADRARIDVLRPTVEKIVAETGRPARLIQFLTMTTLDTIG